MSSLGNYPYINARVHVMKADLVDKSMYEKMPNMSIEDITRYLQDTTYKREINELATQYSGAELVERALDANVSRAFEKVLRLARKEVRFLIAGYLARWNLWNLKAMMRGKASGFPQEEVRKSLRPYGKLYDSFEAIYKSPSIREILAASAKEVPGAEKVLAHYDDRKEVRALENALDCRYYGALSRKAAELPRSGRLIQAFVRTEVDIRNLRTVLRLKREKGMKKEQVIKYMIMPGGHLKRDDLAELASAEEAELAAAIARTRYGPALADSLKGYKETASLAPVQTALEKFWLRQIGLMFHQNPLSINPIIGYILAKEREYKNVRLVAHAKDAGLPKEFITENIIA